MYERTTGGMLKGNLHFVYLHIISVLDKVQMKCSVVSVVQYFLSMLLPVPLTWIILASGWVC